MNPTPSVGLGILAGLAAAAASAVSYLVARHHGGHTGGAGPRLLLPAHALMGAACLPLVWLLWPAAAPPPADWVPPLLRSAGFYLAGQACVYAALLRMPASRLAPLLGIKLAMLAAIASCVPGTTPLDLRQWVAVALSLAAAALLGRGSAGPGRPSGAGGIAIVVAGCLCFAVSDLAIVGLIDAFQAPCTACCPPIGRLHAGALAMAVTYALCGTVTLPFLSRVAPRDRREWTAAIQYAIAWLGGMVALYACFGLLGAVFGNILQSTRGIMAVVAGAVLAHLGWHDLEDRVDRGVLLRRFVAAIVMTMAIAIYAIDVS